MKAVLGSARFLEPSPRSRGSEPDHVSIVEAAYQLDLDDGAWIEGLVRTTAPLLERGLGVVGYFWRVEEDGQVLVIENQVCLGCPPKLPEAVRRAAELTPQDALRDFVAAGPCHSHSEVRDLGADFVKTREINEALLPLVGARDVVTVRATNPDQTSGVAVGACTRNVATVAPRTRAAFSRVAAHIVAATRLRRAVRHNLPPSSVQAAEAVFDARGALLHAEGDAASSGARQALVTAVEHVMTSRGQLRKESSERALEIWRALVSGRWSIVEHSDTDGKRLILARRNQASVPQPAALNADERLVALYTSWGHSNKLIAYELGLSASTVSSLLRSALRKLGLSSRSELLRVFAPPEP
jgi:DNA-binding CsgD family transcriptional regulator